MTNQSAKEQVREILQTIKSGTHVWHDDKSFQSMTVNQALSQIEEIVMGVLGEKEEITYHERVAYDEEIEGEARNDLREEQLKRWSGTIKP